MKIKHTQDLVADAVTMEGAAGCAMQLAISPRDGAPTFAMRFFDIAPGGHTPLHQHPYEHEVYIVAGQGTVWNNGEPESLAPGDVIFVPADEKHQFRNTGKEPFRFMCLIPAKFQKC